MTLENVMRQISMNTPEQGEISTSETTKANFTWYRGESTEFLPTTDALYSATGIQEFVVKGWEPQQRVITKSTNITAFGSCFAANISGWLSQRQYKVLTDKSQSGEAYVIRCGEGMVNSYTIRGQFEWAFEGHVPTGEFWHGYAAEAFGYDEKIRQQTRDIFLKTDLFILTFGLSEVWFDKPTGEVFWRAVPSDKFDPGRHGFRTCSVSENDANIEKIYSLIRQHVPNAKVIFTLSPIPLIATFRPLSCLTANAVSKASLRMAIDAVLQRNAGDGILHYWPSYEIVTECFLDKWAVDRRHVRRPILDYIMTAFEQAWCVKQPSESELMDRLYAARVADGSIPHAVRRVVERSDLPSLHKIMEEWRKAGRPKFADFVERGAAERIQNQGMQKAES